MLPIKLDRSQTLAISAGIGAVCLACLPLVLNDFQLIIATEMLIMAIFALSLNLILGYGGMVHFGHAVFYGLGAFTLAILTRRYGVNPYVAMILAPCVSALAGWLIGWLCVRRVELYFAILTLAFGQLVYVVFLQAREITGGDEGLHGLPLPAWLGEPPAMYGFTLAVFVVCYALMWQLVRSPFILILKSTRENPERARFLGVNVRQHQLIIFVVGAFFAGVAGMLMATEKRFASLDMLHWTTSAEPLLASLLGGMFSLVGAGIGAAVLVFLNFTLSRLTSYWSLALGVLTVGLVLLAPNGLIGWLQTYRRPDDKRE
ncbi:MAG: branched-chain amino acid ABC transporter permease [Phototrophicaceae bacterium]